MGRIWDCQGIRGAIQVAIFFHNSQFLWHFLEFRFFLVPRLTPVGPVLAGDPNGPAVFFQPAQIFLPPSLVIPWAQRGGLEKEQEKKVRHRNLACVVTRDP